MSDDFEVTSSSESPEQVQASLLETPEDSSPEVDSEAPEPAPEAPEEPAGEPEEDLSKYTYKQIHANPTLRIQKATADAAQAKREAAQYAQEAKEAREQLERFRKAPGKPEGQPEGDPEPEEASYDDYRDFVKAQSRWETRQELRERDQQRATEERAFQIKQSASNRVRGYQEQIAAAGGQSFIDKLPEAVLNIDPESPLGTLLMESDKAPQLMEYLRDNPDEIRALSSLHPIRVGRALGRIEGKLEGVAVTATAPRAVSSAKPPVRPVAGSASGGNESSDDGSFEDYVKRENAKERARSH